MLSCEGTRFTEKKRLISMKIAREKGLPELKHHILPRTKGFTLLLQGAENRSKFAQTITRNVLFSEKNLRPKRSKQLGLGRRFHL
jgi:lysophosphatidic acid acyltransferase/lysophosphatidylinositol acyltransferase